MPWQFTGNHVDMVNALIRLGAIPTNGKEETQQIPIEVWHDPDCTIFRGGECDCEPEVVCLAEGFVRVWRFPGVCYAV